MASTAFLKKLVEPLKAAGIEARFDGMYLVVSGAKFSAEDGKKEGKVRFLESSFRVDDDGDFDVARAIGLLMAALPERLKHARATAAYKANREKVLDLTPGCVTEVEEGSGYWHRDWRRALPDLEVGSSAAGIVFRLTVPAEKAAEMLAKLKELPRG